MQFTYEYKLSCGGGVVFLLLFYFLDRIVDLVSGDYILYIHDSELHYKNFSKKNEWSN